MGLPPLGYMPNDDDDARLALREARFRNGNNNRLVFEIEPDDAAIDWWMDKFVEPFEAKGEPGLYPMDMAESLSASGPGNRMYTYRFIDPTAETFELSIKGLDDEGVRIWLHTPVLQISDKRFYQDLIDVDEKYQRRKIGRNLVRDVYRTARLLGLSGLALDADKDGCYAWARAGFVPDRASWINIEQAVKWRLGAADHRITAAIRDEVLDLLARGTEDTRIIRAIADLDYKVSTRNPRAQDLGSEIRLGEALLAENAANWRRAGNPG